MLAEDVYRMTCGQHDGALLWSSDGVRFCGCTCQCVCAPLAQAL